MRGRNLSDLVHIFLSISKVVKPHSWDHLANLNVHCSILSQGVFLINGRTMNEKQTKFIPRSITVPCVSRTYPYTNLEKNKSRVSLEAPETVPRHPIIKANKPGCTLKARQCLKVFFDMTNELTPD